VRRTIGRFPCGNCGKTLRVCAVQIIGLQDPAIHSASLPDNGRLSIKTTRSTDGKVKEGKFDLGAVSEVRSKIAKACDWADGSADEPVGSIDHQEKR
jgi:hypothetical protein